MLRYTWPQHASQILPVAEQASTIGTGHHGDCRDTAEPFSETSQPYCPAKCLQRLGLESLEHSSHVLGGEVAPGDLSCAL